MAESLPRKCFHGLIILGTYLFCISNWWYILVVYTCAHTFCIVSYACHAIFERLFHSERKVEKQA